MATVERDGIRGTGRSSHKQPPSIPQVSPWLLHLFTCYAQHYMRRAFHTVQLSHAGRPSSFPETPLVIYCNHPSWWDPLFCLVLARRFFPEHTHYAPIEASALERYRFFARLGFFGITLGTVRGAATFLRMGQAILRQPKATLWVTPEGRFTDPRQRPVHLQPGLGYLAGHLDRGAFLPVALEYPFWEERFPEALARFGETVWVERQPRQSVTSWTALLASRLEAAQDQLADDACRRHRDAFEVLLHGRAGIGGVYDLWRALRARLRGEPFRKSHGGEAR